MYLKVADYMAPVRTQMQDLVQPYRYTDDQLVLALNNAMFELSRLRADIFLDLKYQQPLAWGDLGNGEPSLFVATRQSDFVPVPSKYYTPVVWYMQAWLQFADVTDTQDQRAGAMLQKFQSMIMTVAA
jgi:hypothetical protein